MEKTLRQQIFRELYDHVQKNTEKWGPVLSSKNTIDDLWEYIITSCEWCRKESKTQKQQRNGLKQLASITIEAIELLDNTNSAI